MIELFFYFSSILFFVTLLFPKAYFSLKKKSFLLFFAFLVILILWLIIIFMPHEILSKIFKLPIYFSGTTLFIILGFSPFIYAIYDRNIAKQLSEEEKHINRLTEILAFIFLTAFLLSFVAYLILE